MDKDGEGFGERLAGPFTMDWMNWKTTFFVGFEE